MVLIQPFPQPGGLVQMAYRELDLLTSRQQGHLLPLRDLANVPRPRDLGTCETQLRKEVWSWLEAIRHLVEPRVRLGCRRCHPALLAATFSLGARDAVLADQRHRAGQALTCEALEEWHR
jgi:hypothetical protein